MNDPKTEDKYESILLRVLWMIVYVLVWQVAQFILGAVVLVQLIYRLIYGAPSASLMNFGDSLSQFLAREWARHGVRVNTLTPGFFPAEQNRRLLFNEDGSPTARAQQILGHTPMGRFGSDGELIGAAVFLASSAASGFVTGSDIRVDGGFLAQTI